MQGRCKIVATSILACSVRRQVRYSDDLQAAVVAVDCISRWHVIVPPLVLVEVVKKAWLSCCSPHVGIAPSIVACPKEPHVAAKLPFSARAVEGELLWDAASRLLAPVWQADSAQSTACGVVSILKIKELFAIRERYSRIGGDEALSDLAMTSAAFRVCIGTAFSRGIRSTQSLL